MNLKIIYHIFFIIAISLLEFSFVNVLPRPLSFLSLSLCAIIFIAVMHDYLLALWWAFGIGILSNLFSIYSFGIIPISLLMSIIIINYLFTRIITNRSLYSLLALGFIGTLIYNFFLWLATNAAYYMQINEYRIILDRSFWLMLSWQSALNVLLLFILFSLSNFVGSVFLGSRYR